MTPEQRIENKRTAEKIKAALVVDPNTRWCRYSNDKPRICFQEFHTGFICEMCFKFKLLDALEALKK